MVLLGAGPARADDGALGFGERSDLHGRFRLGYWGELGAPTGEGSIHRARLDARVGVSVRVLHWAYAVVRARAAADGADPRVGFLDLGDALGAGSVVLDRAYLRVASDRVPELSISAGLVDHPIAAAAPLAWDHDLSPAGVAASYDRRLRSIPLSLRPAGFAYLVRADADGAAAGMFGGELLAELSFAPADLSVAGGVTGFENPDDLTADNTTDRFLLISGRAALELHLLYWLPLEIGGELVDNARAGGAGGRAWSTWLTAGRRDWTGDFDVTYRIRDVGLDAVPAALPADDYRVATGLFAHDLGLVVQVAEKLTAGASASIFRPDVAGADRELVVRVEIAAGL